jgi:hypothetical protein
VPFWGGALKSSLMALARPLGRVLLWTSNRRPQVSTDAFVVAARFAGLSLVTWLIIILIVIVLVALVSRRRV